MHFIEETVEMTAQNAQNDALDAPCHAAGGVESKGLRSFHIDIAADYDDIARRTS